MLTKTVAGTIWIIFDHVDQKDVVGSMEYRCVQYWTKRDHTYRVCSYPLWSKNQPGSCDERWTMVNQTKQSGWWNKNSTVVNKKVVNHYLGSNNNFENVTWKLEGNSEKDPHNRLWGIFSLIGDHEICHCETNYEKEGFSILEFVGSICTHMKFT